LKATLRLLFFCAFCFIILTSFRSKIGKGKKAIICAEYTEKYVDKLTGIKRFIAKEKISLDDYRATNGFDLVWFKTKDEYTLAFKAIEKLCFQNDVAVSFHLLEGKVVTCVSTHIENCESLMTVNFFEDDINSKLSILSESEVVGISFENRNITYKLKMKRHHAEQFQQTIDCLKTKK